ncbi:penicillin acylase family protein [Microbacterium sp. NPDC058389]|uniref:penicillin acylase family protein n=1 Tax=Microbacterium sp. NPDC058389 TaxID=3346475 RepID=UPI0036690260
MLKVAVNKNDGKAPMEHEEWLTVDGLLSDTVVVRTDRWGVAHIQGETARDVFFAQGFVVARERLFQLDWWRRRALGLTAEVLGPDYVERDRASRLFLYRGDMEREWAAYPQGTREAVTAFVAGINEWVERTWRDPGLLSPEFEALGHTPSYWAPADIVRARSHGVYGNLESELTRALTVREFGVPTERVRQPLAPDTDIAVPVGLDLNVLDDKVLDTYRLAMGPVGGTAVARHGLDGSNNWAVSGTKTRSGRPIVANDPHRAVTLPSLRYLIHLTCPEFDVIGAGEPVLPGVSIGHNGAVGFGLTIWPADQEDLYVYELDPNDPMRYRYGDGYEAFTVIEEDIPVRDAGPQHVRLMFTRHGPVICHRPESGTAFAARLAWLEEGMAPYLGSIGYLRARTAEEFEAALADWGGPSVNQAFATVDGDIGLLPRARVPHRPNWDGLFPVPGDGRYEWDGFRRPEDMPRMVNPARGWVGSANQMNLEEFDEWRPVPVGYEWPASFRMTRIAEVLEPAVDLDQTDMAALQNDYLSPPAEHVCALLPEDADSELAVQLLRGWDGRMDTNSPAAFLFEQWTKCELRQAVFAIAIQDLVDPSRRAQALERVTRDDSFLGDFGSEMAVISRMERESPQLLRKTLLSTLTATADRLTKEHGAVHTWSYGRHRTVQLRHIAASLIGDERWTQLRTLPKAGNSETVGAAGFDASGRQTMGSSVRLIIDVGEWDYTIAANTPGQSGDPRSEHFADLYERWAADEYFPLPYSSSAVEAQTVRRLHLTPAEHEQPFHHTMQVSIGAQDGSA